MAERIQTALITGAAGFCGIHMADLLLAQGIQVVGVDLVHGTMLARDGYRPQSLDLRDEIGMRRLVAEIQPDGIVHLAALTNPTAPFRELYEINVFATIQLLEVVRAVAPACTVLIAGSSAQYGLTRPAENPIVEAQAFRPVTQYAVSKATQDLIGGMYSETGLKVIRMRTFNIIGPRQSPDFVASAFARQIAEIELGKRPLVIDVGNLEARRDFVDVRDVVKAYQLSLVHGRSGEVYNVCSGQGRSIGSLLEGLLALSHCPEIEIRPSPARVQRADVPVQVGSFAKLSAHTGWQPAVTFEQSLVDLLDYWRIRVSGRTT